MQICRDMYAFIGISLKRILIFEKFQEEFSKGDDETTQRLQSLSVTRWTARGRAAKVKLDTRETLMQVLLDIDNYTSVNGLARLNGKKLEKDLRRFSKIFGMVFVYEILTFFEGLSLHLQSIDITSGTACFCINKVKEKVQQLREDVEYERMYEIVGKMGLTYYVSTRSRKVPKRYDDSEVLEGLETTLKFPTFFLQTMLKLNANTSK